MNTLTHTAKVRFLSRKDIREIVPVSDMSLWRWMQRGIFPKPVKINSRNYWRQADVLIWCSAHRPNDDSEG